MANHGEPTHKRPRRSFCHDTVANNYGDSQLGYQNTPPRSLQERKYSNGDSIEHPRSIQFKGAASRGDIGVSVDVDSRSGFHNHRNHYDQDTRDSETLNAMKEKEKELVKSLKDAEERLVTADKIKELKKTDEENADSVETTAVEKVKVDNKNIKDPDVDQENGTEIKPVLESTHFKGTAETKEGEITVRKHAEGETKITKDEVATITVQEPASTENVKKPEALAAPKETQEDELVAQPNENGNASPIPDHNPLEEYHYDHDNYSPANEYKKDTENKTEQKAQEQEQEVHDADIDVTKENSDKDFSPLREVKCLESRITKAKTTAKYTTTANISETHKLDKNLIRERFNIIMEHNVMPTLTTGSDINNWLNHLHLALLLLGLHNTLDVVFSGIEGKTMFFETTEIEVGFYIKLILKKYVLLGDLMVQSSLIPYQEQIANVILYATSAADVSLDASLYTRSPIKENGVDYSLPLSAAMESYLMKLKYDEFYMLNVPEDFYDWYVATRVFLSQMGIEHVIHNVKNRTEKKVQFRPQYNEENEYLLRLYCLRTIKVTPLDSAWCGEKMIYRALCICGFNKPKTWVQSRVATLMIHNDDFDRLRDDYYSCLTLSTVLEVPFDTAKVFDIILKRSKDNYRRFGYEYLNNNSNTNVEAFFDYLESSNTLVYDVGAQFELTEEQRKPVRKRTGGGGGSSATERSHMKRKRIG